MSEPRATNSQPAEFAFAYWDAKVSGPMNSIQKSSVGDETGQVYGAVRQAMTVVAVMNADGKIVLETMVPTAAAAIREMTVATAVPMEKIQARDTGQL